MLKSLTPTDIKYICRSMLGVDWLPSFIDIPTWVNQKRAMQEQEAILQILSKCDSKLEVMYFLGMAYYLHGNGVRNSTSEEYPNLWPDKHESQLGIHVSEPFCGGRYGNGFSSLLVIPQWQSPEKPIHHDFGFFSGASNGGGPWGLYAAVEIEGYAVHKQQRQKDETRYAGLSYPVISLYEKQNQPHDWYKVFDPDIATGIKGEWFYGDDEDGPDGVLTLFDFEPF